MTPPYILYVTVAMDVAIVRRAPLLYVTSAMDVAIVRRASIIKMTDVRLFCSIHGNKLLNVQSSGQKKYENDATATLYSV